jgi:hypothetical protein
LRKGFLVRAVTGSQPVNQGHSCTLGSFLLQLGVGTGGQEEDGRLGVVREPWDIKPCNFVPEVMQGFTEVGKPAFVGPQRVVVPVRRWGIVGEGVNPELQDGREHAGDDPCWESRKLDAHGHVEHQGLLDVLEPTRLSVV